MIDIKFILTSPKYLVLVPFVYLLLRAYQSRISLILQGNFTLYT